jgi:hypothetical protein
LFYGKEGYLFSVLFAGGGSVFVSVFVSGLVSPGLVSVLAGLDSGLGDFGSPLVAVLDVDLRLSLMYQPDPLKMIPAG